MVSETSLPELMTRVCKEVENIAPEVTACIPDGRHERPGSSPGGPGFQTTSARH